MKKTVLISSLIALSSLTANAQVVDQQNVSLDPDLLTLLDGDLNQYMAQSFTAGMTGNLTKVEFGLTSSSGMEETVYVRIFKGSIESEYVEFPEIVKATIPADGSTIPFAEFESIEVTEGEIYTIFINNREALFAPLFVYGTTNLYATGNLTYGFPAQTDTEGDLLFRTFVSEPTAITSSYNKQALEVYPNPSMNDKLNFSIELTNVKLLSQTGNTVVSLNSAKEIETTNIEAGIYTLVSDQGTQKVTIIK